MSNLWNVRQHNNSGPYDTYVYLNDTRSGFVWMCAVGQGMIQQLHADLLDKSVPMKPNEIVESFAEASVQIAAETAGNITQEQENQLGMATLMYLTHTRTWSDGQAQGCKHYLLQIYPDNAADPTSGTIRPVGLATTQDAALSPNELQDMAHLILLLDAEAHPEWFGH